MRFIQLDIKNPKEILQELKEGREGMPPTRLEKIIHKLTMTSDDAIAFFIFFMAEFFATFLLLCLGCGSIAKLTEDRIVFPESVVFGFLLILFIEIFGWISGTHMNPAVTFVAVLSNKISFQKFFFYFIAQILGSICGYVCLKLLIPREVDAGNCAAGCITLPNTDVSTVQAFAIELIAGILLAFFCCSIWDAKNESLHESVSLRFAFAMVALIFSIGKLTGGSLNPVRSFAPALYNNCWDKHWVYWAGPFSGCILGAVLHDLLFRPDCYFEKHDEFEPVDAQFIVIK